MKRSKAESDLVPVAALGSRTEGPVTPTPSLGTDLNFRFKDKKWTKGQVVCVLNRSGSRCGPMHHCLSLDSAKELEVLPRRSHGLVVSIRAQPHHHRQLFHLSA